MKPIRALTLLALATLACGYMADQHAAWVSPWWWVWEVALFAGSFWMGHVTVNLWRDTRAARARERMDEREEYE